MTSLVISLAVIWGGFCIWLAVFRRAYFLAFIFFLFGFTTRMASVTFIDGTGPVFSLQLDRFLSPNGSTVTLFASYVVVILAVAIVFRRSRLDRAVRSAEMVRQRSRVRNGLVSDLAFAAYVLFFAALYLDLFRRGEIPLFTGMERYEYTQHHGGTLHGVMMEWSNIFAMQIGVLFVIGRRGKPARRFLGLLVPMLAYYFLTGHRFSAFYATSGLFLLPVGLAQLGKRRNSGKRLVAWLRANIWKFIGAAMVAMLVVGLASSALYNSYFKVRAHADVDPVDRIMVRVLIEPGELWHATHGRVFQEGDFSPRLSFHHLFREPLLPGRNSTPPLLMYLSMGAAAFDQLDNGTTYAGGYPEVFFELAGPWGGWFLLFAMAWAMAELFLFLARCLWSHRLVTALLTPFVIYALTITVISGMLNYLLRWTFWVKLAALGCSAMLDRMPRYEKQRPAKPTPAEAASK